MRIYYSAFLFSFLTCILFSSCDSKSDTPPAWELKVSDTRLSFPADEKTSNMTDGLFYLASDKVLFSLSMIENGVHLYDLEREQKIKTLKFESEGPNGTFPVLGIHALSMDSIFLFSPRGEIALIDSSGQVKSKFSYDHPEPYSGAFVHNAYFTSPPLLQGDKMIVKTRYPIRITDMTQAQLQETELVYELDLKTGDTRLLNFKFPKDYIPNGVKVFEASIAHGAGKHVYSLFGDHRLFFVSNFGEELQSKDGKSEFLPESLPLFPPQADGLQFRDYSYFSPHYESLEYDPFRNVFIRFAFHSFQVNEDAAPAEMRNYSGPFSIQIFDENLDLVSETAFEANRFHPFSYFIGQKGIYLSTNHPLNPENSEDEMTFALLEYVDNEGD
jgi:hypothetical protein